jgi:tetratricopeptide (TPR) repeat protein
MKRGLVLAFDEARRRKAANRRARWIAVADDLAGEVWPQLQPSFRLEAGHSVFTIGSCFARNIEQHLADLGCRVPMLDLRLPAEEFHGQTNGAMNRFHPPAFRQCLEWAAAIWDRGGDVAWADCEPLAFDWGDGRLFDLDMGCDGPVTRERFLERRRHVYAIFSQVFTADCLMMTPGLIEAWRDKATGLYIHEPPTHKALHRQRERWELEILTYEQCQADLLAAIDVVRARNPTIKVLITTSPVPLTATFSGQDVLVANSQSKAVLRAVCGAVPLLRPMTDYFPSYESATLSFPTGVWAPDRLHVSQPFIGKIVAQLVKHYFEGVDEAGRALQEARTLMADARPAEAEALAHTALAARPDDVDVRALLAAALLAQGRCAEAEAESRAAAGLAPERADLWIGVARAVSRSDKARAGEALELVERAAALPSMGLSEFRAVGELIRRKAAPADAERLARRAIELFPLHVEAYPLLAQVLVDQGRKGEAIEVLRKAAPLRRATPAMLTQLAELLAEAGETAEALQMVDYARVRGLDGAGADALAARIAPVSAIS